MSHLQRQTETEHLTAAGEGLVLEKRVFCYSNQVVFVTIPTIPYHTSNTVLKLINGLAKP